jgi:hypothetical protein
VTVDFGVIRPLYPVIGAFSSVVIVSWMPLKYLTVFTVNSAVASSSHTMQDLQMIVEAQEATSASHE